MGGALLPRRRGHIVGHRPFSFVVVAGWAAIATARAKAARASALRRWVAASRDSWRNRLISTVAVTPRSPAISSVRSSCGQPVACPARSSPLHQIDKLLDQPLRSSWSKTTTAVPASIARRAPPMGLRLIDHPQPSRPTQIAISGTGMYCLLWLCPRFPVRLVVVGTEAFCCVTEGQPGCSGRRDP